MKVKITNNNAPRPFIGALIGAGADLIGSSIDAAVGASEGQKQREHDKEMAGLNQQNILAQMEQANKYQVEQWNRENEYNDPTAVAERYRKAGINPRAAFGTGSASGSGIAGGLSGAPSGSSTGSASNAMFTPNFGGLGSSVVAGARLSAQNKKDEAEAEKAYQDARSKSLANAEAEFMKKNGAWIAKLAETKSNSLISSYTANMKAIDADMYDFEHKVDLQNKYLAGVNALKNIELATANIERLSKLNELTDEEKEMLKSQREKCDSETARIKADNACYKEWGFYPPVGSTLEAALIGLGAKGIGELAERLKGKNVTHPANVVTAELVNEYKEAKTPEEKNRVVAKMHGHATSIPLSRGVL